MTRFLDPQTVHEPVGAYSHTVSIPAGTEMVFLSGQVGVRPDGSIPETFAEQADWVFKNIRACVEAHGLAMDAIVKLTCFVLSGQDMNVFREVRQQYLGHHRPASTVVYVPQLVGPSFLVEVEAVAVKAGHATDER